MSFQIMRCLLKPVLLVSITVLSVTSCATEKEAPKKKLYNPGDELNTRPWGQGSKAQHYATPFGLPLSQ